MTERSQHKTCDIAVKRQQFEWRHSFNSRSGQLPVVHWPCSSWCWWERPVRRPPGRAARARQWAWWGRRGTDRAACSPISHGTTSASGSALGSPCTITCMSFTFTAGYIHFIAHYCLLGISDETQDSPINVVWCGSIFHLPVVGFQLRTHGRQRRISQALAAHLKVLVHPVTQTPIPMQYLNLLLKGILAIWSIKKN